MRNIEFHIAHSIEPRWYSFKVLNLKQNHRQGDDKPYADMLDRIRVGEQTNEDIKLLKTRVRPKGHTDLREVSIYIVCKRKECALKNIKYQNSVKGELYKIKAVHHNATQKKYKPLIDHKDGAIARTSFMNELNLKFVVKVMIIHNIDTKDRLTNGQMGELVSIIKTTKGDIDKLIIRLKKYKCRTVKQVQISTAGSKIP